MASVGLVTGDWFGSEPDRYRNFERQYNAGVRSLKWRANQATPEILLRRRAFVFPLPPNRKSKNACPFPPLAPAMPMWYSICGFVNTSARRDCGANQTVLGSDTSAQNPNRKRRFFRHTAILGASMVPDNAPFRILGIAVLGIVATTTFAKPALFTLYNDAPWGDCGKRGVHLITHDGRPSCDFRCTNLGRDRHDKA